MQKTNNRNVRKTTGRNAAPKKPKKKAKSGRVQLNSRKINPQPTIVNKKSALSMSHS